MAHDEKIEHEWVANLRRDERWQEGRLARACTSSAEVLALTGDLSLGGLRLALYGIVPKPSEQIDVEIAFEDQITRVSGTVRHVSSTDWGSVVGIAFEETGQTTLARRFVTLLRQR